MQPAQLQEIGNTWGKSIDIPFLPENPCLPYTGWTRGIPSDEAAVKHQKHQPSFIGQRGSARRAETRGRGDGATPRCEASPAPDGAGQEAPSVVYNFAATPWCCGQSTDRHPGRSDAETCTFSIWATAVRSSALRFPKRSARSCLTVAGVITSNTSWDHRGTGQDGQRLFQVLSCSQVEIDWSQGSEANGTRMKGEGEDHAQR